MLEELNNLLSFLTVFGWHMDENTIKNAARLMFLFPVIGAFVGFLAGLFGWVCLHLSLPTAVVGGLVLGVLLLLTGLHHTDGLLDFGDGVMAHGTAEHKVDVMHDQLTGAGGLALGMMTLLVVALALGQLNVFVIIQSVVVAEVGAKLAMVIGAWAGKPVRQGMASAFLEAMHGGKGNARLVAALVISFTFGLPLFFLNDSIAGFIAIFAAVVTGLAMVGVAHRHFHGVTGDVLGATNELARMVSVVVLVALL